MKSTGSTPHALLGLLTLRPMSGYDIRQLIPKSIGHFWSESYGQIYPSLKHLAASGLIEKETERKAGRPDRHVYSLTEAGRESLRTWLGVPVGPPVPRNELLLKLFFGAQTELGVSREHIKACEAGNLRAIAVYEAVRRRLVAEEQEDPQLPFWLMTLSYGRHLCGATVAWCRETLRELDRLEAEAGQHASR